MPESQKVPTTMMLQKKAAASLAGRNVRASRKASVVVSCQAKPFEPVKQVVAALAAASIVLVSP